MLAGRSTTSSSLPAFRLPPRTPSIRVLAARASSSNVCSPLEGPSRASQVRPSVGLLDVESRLAPADIVGSTYAIRCRLSKRMQLTRASGPLLPPVGPLRHNRLPGRLALRAYQSTSSSSGADAALSSSSQASQAAFAELLTPPCASTTSSSSSTNSLPPFPAPRLSSSSSSSPIVTAPTGLRERKSPGNERLPPPVKDFSDLRETLLRLKEQCNGDLMAVQRELEHSMIDLEAEVERYRVEKGRADPTFERMDEISQHFLTNAFMKSSGVQKIRRRWTKQLERALLVALHPRVGMFSRRPQARHAFSLFTTLDQGHLVLTPHAAAEPLVDDLFRAVLERINPSDVLAHGHSQRGREHKKGILDLLTSPGEPHYEASSTVLDIPYIDLCLRLAETLEIEYYRQSGYIDDLIPSGPPSDSERVNMLNEGQRVGKTLPPPARPTPKFGDPAHDLALGAAVLELMMSTFKIVPHKDSHVPGEWVEEVPAFSKIDSDIMKGQRYQKKLVKPHPTLLRLVQENKDIRAYVRVTPMLVKPDEWTQEKDGGPLDKSRTTFIKSRKDPERQRRFREQRVTGKLGRVFEAINHISSTPWVVNSDMLSIVRTSVKIFSFGMPPPAQPTQNETPKAFVDRSIQLQHTLPIHIAVAFEGSEFYLPHSVDYRGRAYPMSPYLQPCGDDVVRSLLLFRDGRPLGVDGLRWLKIHLAGMAGEDKETFEAREAYTDAHLDVIRASAEKPFETDWWIKLDKPFEALAACQELVKALDYPDGPEAFPSSLPIHQDGTCNGLQYYAALGRDERGGRSVNLIPHPDSNKPQDVYSEVLDVVKQIVEKKKKPEIAYQHPDVLLTRKTVKTTVMTSVYGVTDVGAEDQVFGSLLDIRSNRAMGDDDPVFQKLPDDELRKVAKELSADTLSAISTLFPVATSIQQWLKTCLEVIFHSSVSGNTAGGTSNTMTWNSPLGFPITQGYREQITETVRTLRQKISFNRPDAQLRVNLKREQNGFAPNYIHSLDASHLFMTALGCKGEDTVFASVHDSFWTHAASTETLNRVLREAFVALHSNEESGSLLEDLRSQLIARYGDNRVNDKELCLIARAHEKYYLGRLEAGIEDDQEDPWVRWTPSTTKPKIYVRDVLPPVPKRGNLDINTVLVSPFFFK